MRRDYGGGGGLAYLATHNLSSLSISPLLLSHPALLAPNPALRPISGSGNCPKASLSYSGNVSIVLTWYLISTKETEGENYSPSHLQYSRKQRKIDQVEV